MHTINLLPNLARQAISNFLTGTCRAPIGKLAPIPVGTKLKPVPMTVHFDGKSFTDKLPRTLTGLDYRGILVHFVKKDTGDFGSRGWHITHRRTGLAVVGSAFPTLDAAISAAHQCLYTGLPLNTLAFGGADCLWSRWAPGLREEFLSITKSITAELDSVTKAKVLERAKSKDRARARRFAKYAEEQSKRAAEEAAASSESSESTK